MLRAIKLAVYPAVALLPALFVAGCGALPAAPARPSDDAVRQAMAVQKLRRDLAELRNSVEMHRHSLERFHERQRRLYEDLDNRLQEREEAAASRQLAYGRSRRDNAPSPDGTRQGRSGAAEAQVYGQQGVARGQQATREAGGADPPAQSLQTASPGRPTAASRRNAERRVVASAEEQAAYDEAFDLMKQGRYADAVVKFRSLIEEFPRGALIDDAQYWIGEAYYVGRAFKKALSAFRAVVDRYPDSQRIPEAMLKLGYIQAEMGRITEARRTLNQIISEYPESRVAISAETRLSQL